SQHRAPMKHELSVETFLTIMTALADSKWDDETAQVPHATHLRQVNPSIRSLSPTILAVPIPRRPTPVQCRGLSRRPPPMPRLAATRLIVLGFSGGSPYKPDFLPCAGPVGETIAVGWCDSRARIRADSFV